MAAEWIREATESGEDQGCGDVWKRMSALIDIEIHRLVKYAGDPSTYWLSTSRGDITIGKIDNLTSQTKFTNLVADATGKMINPCKPYQWRQRVQIMLNACEVQDVGNASHPVTETRAWLGEYLLEHAPGEDPEAAAIAKATFVIGRTVYIFAERFSQWVEHHHNEKMSSHVISRRLKMCEAVAEKVNIRVNGKRTSRGCWALPEDIMDEVSGAPETEESPGETPKETDTE